MQRLREWLTLVLLGLLPFHALGVTVLTRLIAGPVHAPLAAVALWKEALLAVILLLALAETLYARTWRARMTVDRLDVCIGILALSLFLATVLGAGSLAQVLYGIRYDLLPLGAFLLLRRAAWSDAFPARAGAVLATAAIVTTLYALLTLLLPPSFFQFLGYSDLHSLYIPGRPIAAFQQIGGTALRRVQGPMSGPNQLGIWLAAVLPFVLSLRPNVRRWAASLVLIGIVLTLSRAAWIAAAVLLIITVWPQLKRLSISTVTILCIGVLTLLAATFFLFPSVILRMASSADHLRHPLEAVGILFREPLGRGLGSAGPAQNRVSDACVYQAEGSDVAWARVHQDLCVFTGQVQVQPVDRTCRCPFLPENWYLQLGVEGGWIAMVAFTALTVLVLVRLRRDRSPVFLSLLAGAIAALFLHAWEDAAVAWTVWILVAVTLTIVPNAHRLSSGSARPPEGPGECS